MALYEMRTYTLRVGAMAEAVKLYQELGYPALQKGGHDKKKTQSDKPARKPTGLRPICGLETWGKSVG